MTNTVSPPGGSKQRGRPRSDDDPAWLKRGVGMLKLVEVRDSISGIGCRGAENAYFVIKRSEA